MLSFKVLGPFQVYDGEQPVPDKAFRSATARSLLKYLVVHRNQVIGRERLIDLFWPESSQESGQSSLYATISHLRQALKLAVNTGDTSPQIIRQSQGYMLTCNAHGQVDHDQYLALVRQAEVEAAAQNWGRVAETIAATEALVRGDFLACEPYADWAGQSRREFHQLRLKLLDMAVNAHMNLHNWHQAAALAQLEIQIDPLVEGAYRHLMVAYEALHEPVLALRAYDQCRRVLVEELGIEPGAATQALHERFLSAQPTPPSPISLQPTSVSKVRHNLPLGLSSFIGRESDIAKVRELLAGSRLVTLMGAGGSGKTRLALRVAAEMVGLYGDGVWLVDLAPVRDPVMVVQAVASAVGLNPAMEGALLDELASYLVADHRLLILDNCEHLLATCQSVVNKLLRTCPRLSVLATSREGLRIEGETTWLIPLLSLPPMQHHMSLADLARYDSIQLFVERARLVRPNFVLTADNAIAIVSICHRLDGIPLAIELAAARVRSLGVEEIAVRLRDRFRLLTGGQRSALPRQQTLRALVDWSYDLLSDQERQLWRRISVFIGSFSLQAVEESCAQDGISPDEVLDLMSQLAEKSLVVLEDVQGQTRYHLLETMREYGVERLRESGEDQVQRRRHRDWYLALVEQASPHLTGPEQVVWMNRLQTENDNLWAALRWSREVGDTHEELRLIVGLWTFWTYHYSTRLSDWIEELLALPHARAYPTLWPRVLHGAGILAFWQGDFQKANAHFEEMCRLHGEHGNKQGMVEALERMGFVCLFRGEYDRGAALLQEAYALGAESAPMLMWLRSGLALYCGHLDEAAALNEQILAMGRAQNSETTISHALTNLGHVALYQGHYARAATLFEESFLRYRSLKYQRYLAQYMPLLGLAALGMGRRAYAVRCLEESLARYREMGGRYKIGLPDCLEAVAVLCHAEANHTAAATLLAAAQAIRATLCMPIPLVAQAKHMALVAAVARALDADQLLTISTKVKVMPLQQVFDYALQSLNSPQQSPVLHNEHTVEAV